MENYKLELQISQNILLIQCFLSSQEPLSISMVCNKASNINTKTRQLTDLKQITRNEIASVNILIATE